MAEQTEINRRRAAALSNLMDQMRRSPELARLMILLIVWGHVRSRAGYSTVAEQSVRLAPRQKRGQRRKSFSLKRPRERFL